MIGVLQPGAYREVVVFSGDDPVFRERPPQGDHRGRPEGQRRKRDFSIHDPEAGVTYHSSCTEHKVAPGSPRHHHTFEQVRFILSGKVVYGQRTFSAGWLGYFPEGVYYGPQEQIEQGTGFTVQFPGPSGYPFHSRYDTVRGTELARTAGAKFEDGIAVWPDGRKQDAHEAVMEALYGVEAEYPAPKYSEQVWINHENFAWAPSSIPGVSVKRLAFFGERGPAVQLLKLDPGASTPAGTTGAFMIRYIFEGDADYNGEFCPAVSNIFYPPSAPYQALSTKSGATALSIEIQAQLPGSEPPLPYRI